MLILVACSASDTSEMVVNANSCAHEGPETMIEGDIRVSVSMSGLGNAGVSIVRLDEEKTLADLVAYHEQTPDAVENPPGWIETQVTMRIGDRYAATGDSQTIALTPGEYVVLCLDYPYEDPAVANDMWALRVTGT